MALLESGPAGLAAESEPRGGDIIHMINCLDPQEPNVLACGGYSPVWQGEYRGEP